MQRPVPFTQKNDIISQFGGYVWRESVGTQLDGWCSLPGMVPPPLNSEPLPRNEEDLAWKQIWKERRFCPLPFGMFRGTLCRMSYTHLEQPESWNGAMTCWDRKSPEIPLLISTALSPLPFSASRGFPWSLLCSHLLPSSKAAPWHHIDNSPTITFHSGSLLLPHCFILRTLVIICGSRR